MNEAPSNQSGIGDFGSQPASQTNPFTADLKGEFTSNFGTNTNAVSQIFKEGGFAGTNNRTKYLIIGGVAIVVLAIVFFVMTGEESEPQFAETSDDLMLGEEDTAMKSDESAEDSSAAESAEAEDSEDAMAEDDSMAEAEEGSMAETTAPVDNATATEPMAAPAAGTASTGFAGGPITLVEPADGSSLVYDETQGPAQFSWEGGGGYITFSRSQTMSPVVMRVPVSGNSYAFHHPWPGTWFWQMENSSGSTEIRSFRVEAPARRNVQITAPAGGGALAGNGGVVTWQGDAKVAYYRVELSTGGWATPQHRFASSGNSVSLNGVAPGQYQMRVGAFSEVSGRWEYTAPVSVTVQ